MIGYSKRSACMSNISFPFIARREGVAVRVASWLASIPREQR